MNWPLPSIALATLSAAAAAVTLVLLHLLKIQPPRKTVATVIFWRQAVKDERRRVLPGRFSRWRTFVLLLLVALLLAAALAGTRWPARWRGEPVVLVIDAGFSMKVPTSDGKTRLDRAVEAVRADLQDAGDAPVTIIAAGQYPRLLARPAETSAIASASLREISASETDAASEQAIELAAHLLPRNQGTILWYTDRRELPQSIPPEVRARVRRRGVGTSADNAAIVAVTFEPVDTDRALGRLRVRVASWGSASSLVEARLTHRGTTTAKSAAAGASGNIADLLFDQLRADGGECTVDLLNGGAAPEDDQATFRLPRWVSIRPRIVGAIPQPLRSAVDAIAKADAQGAVELLLTDAVASTSNQPTIQLVHNDSGVRQGSTISLEASPLTAGLNLEGALCGSGSDLRAGGAKLTPLLKAGDAVLLAISDDSQRLLVSDAIFAPGTNLPQRPAFVLLLMRACRVLGGGTPTPAMLTFERQRSDPLWAPRDGTERDVLASVVSRTSGDLSTAPEMPTSTDRLGHTSWRYEPWQLALAAAIGLLLVEGLMHWRGRIV